MENKIWDILENVRQGYITVNDGTQQVLDLFAVIKSLPDSDEIRMKALRDVDKAFDEFVKDKIIWWNELTPNRLKAVVKDMKAFAKFFAQRCGVEVDGECEHPYHWIGGGNGSPERCLKCGRVLSK